MSGSTPAPTNEPVWKILERYAGGRVNGLQNRYRDSVPAAKAALAQLRHCDPATTAGVLDAWEAVFSDAPPELIGRGDSPTQAENALVAALHLYAVHQQSKQDPMHVPGTGLGVALRRLANPGDPDSRERPTMRRYHALSSATESAEILHYLRGLVRQLRDAGIPLDYAKLATDLYFLSSPTTRTQVRLTWARDLMRKPKTENGDPEPSAIATTDTAPETMIEETP